MTATTAIEAVRASDRSRPRAVTPSKSGSPTSIRMRFGCCSAARATPVAAFRVELSDEYGNIEFIGKDVRNW